MKTFWSQDGTFSTEISIFRSLPLNLEFLEIKNSRTQIFEFLILKKNFSQKEKKVKKINDYLTYFILN